MENFNDSYNYFIEKLGEKCIIRNYSKKESIFTEALSQDYVYIIKEGQATINKVTLNWEDRILFVLSEGYILNEEILFSADSSCATSCVAVENISLYCITKHQLLKAMQEDYKICEYVLKNSNNKLIRSYRQLKNAGSDITLDKKIVSKLWKLARDYGIGTEKGILISTNVSSTIIAKMVGAKRESVSRKLSELKKENVIHIEHDKIYITDCIKLEELMKH